MSTVVRKRPSADAAVSEVADRLVRDGFVRIDASFVGADTGELAFARDQFAQGVEIVPPDTHTDKPGRNRRYGTFLLTPWNGALEFVPPVWDASRMDFVARYLQSASINPEQQGQSRGFAPLTPELANNIFLRATIQRCFRALPWNTPGPVFAGVHVIQLVANPGVLGVSSPDALHRDGEPFTWAFLLERHGVTGGENVIAAPELANSHPSDAPPDKILARFTLDKPFEGWVVDDKRVSHYVSPVAVEDGFEHGVRTILLIDFTPAVPGIEQ
jgi:hypothetical protein